MWWKGLDMHSTSTERKNINCTQQKYDACNPSMRRREREREMRKEKGEREGWCFSEFSNCVCFCLLSISRPPSLSLSLFTLSHTNNLPRRQRANDHWTQKTFSHTLSLFHHTALTSPTSSPLSLAVAGRGGQMYVCGTNSPLLHSSSRPTLPSPLPEQALHVASSSSSWCCLIFHNSQQQQEQPLEKEAKDRPSWSSSRLCCWLSSSPSKLDPEVGRLIQYRLYFYTWIHDLDRLWVVNWIVERGKEIWKVFVLLFSFRRWLETFWVKKKTGFSTLDPFVRSRSKFCGNWNFVNCKKFDFNQKKKTKTSTNEKDASRLTKKGTATIGGGVRTGNAKVVGFVHWTTHSVRHCSVDNLYLPTSQLLLNIFGSTFCSFKLILRLVNPWTIYLPKKTFFRCCFIVPSKVLVYVLPRNQILCMTVSMFQF